MSYYNQFHLHSKYAIQIFIKRRKRSVIVPQSVVVEFFYELPAETLRYLDHFQNPLHNSKRPCMVGKEENGSVPLEERVHLLAHQGYETDFVLVDWKLVLH